MMHVLPLLLTLLALPTNPQEPTRGKDDSKPTPSGRELLERGAYVEEFERDFDQALSLFEQAKEKADASGDEATAKEAARAAGALSARRDGTPRPAVGQESEELVTHMGALLMDISSLPSGIGKRSLAYESLAKDLAVYGSAVVPWLEELLQGRSVDMGPFQVSLNSRIAIWLLVDMHTEDADAVLVRVLSANDPLLRRTAVRWMNPTVYRSLLEGVAREDPVPQVRAAAVEVLMRLHDPSLLPLVMPLAESGDQGAVSWIGDVEPSLLLDFLQQADASDAFVTHVLQELLRQRTPPRLSTVDLVLSIVEGRRSDACDSAALWTLGRLLDTPEWDSALPNLSQHVEERLLKNWNHYRNLEGYRLLARVGDMQAFEVLSREWSRMPSGSSESDRKELAEATRSLLERLTPDDFEAIAALVSELPVPTGSSRKGLPGNGWHLLTLQRLEDLAGDEEISAIEVANACQRLEGPRRRAFLRVVFKWLRDPRLWNPSGTTPPELGALAPAMRDLLATGDSDKQGVAILGLTRIADFESLPRLIELTTPASSVNWNGYFEEVRALCAKDPEQASLRIEATFRSGLATVGALRFLSPSRALSLFHVLWPDLKDGPWRKFLLNSLIDDVEGVEADAEVLRLYDEASDAGMRVRMIRRLSRHLFEPAIPKLAEALRDPDAEVRDAAYRASMDFRSQREALEEFTAWIQGDKAARGQIDELLELLRSPKPEVVLGAVKSLGAIRARAALPALVRLLGQEDKPLHAAVNDAIDRIGE